MIKLVSGKLSKCLYSYTPLVISYSLHDCHWIHNFNFLRMSLNTRKAKFEIWLYYCKCHKINLSGPFGYFLFDVILTTSYMYLREWTIETSSLPKDSLRPLIKQIEIFSGVLTAYCNCKYFSMYTREILGCLLGANILQNVDVPSSLLVN